MKAFLLKYKWVIAYWIVFGASVLYFAPREHDYYLDDDITKFKNTQVAPFLIWTGAAASLLILTLVLRKIKPIKRLVGSFFFVVVAITFFLFILQDLFLGAALFLNREFKKGELQKNFLVDYMAGEDKTKDSFVPYDLATHKISIESKLINKLYDPRLKRGDTITLRLDIGILGVPFQSTPFVTN